MTAPKYLTGQSRYDDWSARHTLGDVLSEQHLEANPEPVPFMERNSGRLIVLCIVGLGAIGAASWGLSVVNDIALDRIEMSVD